MSLRAAAAERWATALGDWQIPDRVLRAAPEDPWAFPTDLFQRRADRTIGRITTPSDHRAAATLGNGGSVLDVGAGGGAAGLALAGRLTHLTAVDTSGVALAELARRASAAGVAARTVVGSWPEVARDVEVHDVVVCHHVAYNVPHLAPFATALHERARRRVVIELTDRHPMHAMNPLWLRFHGIRRPDRPSATDALAVIRELGIDARIERWMPDADPDPLTRDERAALVRRRLCLPVEREPAVAAALAEMEDGPQCRATIWWDRHAQPRVGEG